jgi:hypothetical protein
MKDSRKLRETFGTSMPFAAEPVLGFAESKGNAIRESIVFHETPS